MNLLGGGACFHDYQQVHEDFQLHVFLNHSETDKRVVLPEKYASEGGLRFTLQEVLKVPPISQRRNVDAIIRMFGGADKLRSAVNQLKPLLYS